MVALKLKHMVRDSNSGHQLLLPPSKRCLMFAYWVQVVEPIGGRDFKDCAGRESVPQEDGLNLSIASGYTTAEEPDHVSLRLLSMRGGLRGEGPDGATAANRI